MSENSAFDLMDRAASRRRFLREGGLAAVIAGVATACKPETVKAPAVAQSGTPAGQTGGTALVIQA